jgi:hypothetical protein
VVFFVVQLIKIGHAEVYQIVVNWVMFNQLTASSNETTALTVRQQKKPLSNVEL